MSDNQTHGADDFLDDDIEADFAFNEIYRDIPVLWEDQFKKFKVPMNA